MNTHKPMLIISLTSYPQRISTVNIAIKSLFKQSLRADKIILWLALEDFKNREKDLPKQLLDLRSSVFSIEWYNNLGPHMKLIPTLKKYPHALVVTADDDAIYPYNWLKNLHKSYLLEKNAIHCHRVRKIIIKNGVVQPYNTWILNDEKILNSSFLNFPTGVGGCLYPPNSLNQRIFNEKDLKKICPYADDIWFWAHALLNKTKIKLVDKKNRAYFENIPGTQSNALGKYNIDKGGNDKQVYNIIEKYPRLLDILISQ